MAKPSRAMWKQLNKNKQLDRRLENAAKRVASRAQAISDAEGGTATYTVRSGTRPGGRSFYDVVSDNPFEEFGTEEVPRIGALRRAARGG